MKDLKRLSISLKVLCVSIFVLMCFGAFVRTMNAGLTCPDWPLCFGKFIPEYHFGVYLEFVHRAYAGLETLLFIYCFWMIQKNKTLSKNIKKISYFALGILLLQVLMGGLTVLLLLKSVIVTSHLILATLFISSIFWLTQLVDQEILKNQNPEDLQNKLENNKQISSSMFFNLAKTIPYLIFAQLIMGGFVASTYSGLVCLDFPKCNGEWFPSLHSLIGIQMLHRYFAYLVFIAILLIRFLGALEKPAKIRFWSRILLFIASIQIALGILNLKLYLPSWGAVAHHGVAVLLLLTSLRLVFVLRGMTLLSTLPGLNLNTGLKSTQS